MELDDYGASLTMEASSPWRNSSYWIAPLMHPGPLKQTMRDLFILDFSMISRTFKIFMIAHLLASKIVWRKLETFTIPMTRWLPRRYSYCIVSPGSGPMIDKERHDKPYSHDIRHGGWKEHHGYKYQILSCQIGCVWISIVTQLSPQRPGIAARVTPECNAGEAQYSLLLGRWQLSYRFACYWKAYRNPPPLRNATRIGLLLWATFVLAMSGSIYSVTANLYPFIKWRVEDSAEQACKERRFVCRNSSKKCSYVSLRSLRCYFNCPAPNLFDYFN